MENSNLPHRTWAFAYYLLSVHPKGVAALQLMKELGIPYETAWSLAHRIRRTWETWPQVAKGPIEIDEAYQGGHRKWMNAKRKANLVDRRTGTAAKLPIVGMRDRNTGNVQTIVIAQLD